MRVHRGETRSAAAQATAVVVTILIGMRVDTSFGLTVGGVLAIILTPIWIGSLTRNRWASGIVTLTLVAPIAGYLLTSLHVAEHSSVNHDLFARSIQVLQFGVMIGFLLWASRVSSIYATTISFATGLALAIPLHANNDGNIWRFTLSVPLGVLILALCSRYERVGVSVFALCFLASIGLLNDSRSNSAFLLLTAVVIMWQRLTITDSRRTRGWGGIVVVTGAAASMALLLQGAILDGAFGEVTQARTAEQIERGGNALLGGRPEIAATASFIAKYPLGIGSGIRANYDDILEAKSAMAGIGYDPNNGYVNRFMFGTGIELHSVIGDLWMWFGLVGVTLVLLVLVLLSLGLKRGYAAATLTPLFVYLALRVAWDVLFSPFSSALRLWPLAITLAIAYASHEIFSRRPSLKDSIPVTEPTEPTECGYRPLAATA